MEGRILPANGQIWVPAPSIMRQPIKLGRIFVGLLALMLVVFMTIEVAHTHAEGAGDVNTAAHCQICATAHVAAASQPAWLTGFVLHLIGSITIGEPTRGSRTVVRTAFIRPPPPVDSALA